MVEYIRIFDARTDGGLHFINLDFSDRACNSDVADRYPYDTSS